MKYLIEEALHGKTDSSQHYITLFSIAISLKAKNILELGVRNGGTTKPLIDAVNYTKGKLVSVDLKKDNTIVEQFEQLSNWEYIIKDALSFLKDLSPEVIFDLIFIDDWHDGEHVLQEIMLLEKHVTPSSLILLHDTMCNNTQPNYHYYSDTQGEFANGGPYAALQQLDQNIWEFSTIPVNNGLTILRKKGETLHF
jgi:predicted O-methyltransferase YrrM